MRHFSWLTVGLCLAVFYERRVVSVEDQVMLVSEASQRIGKAIARAFAEWSAQVVITGRELHSLERAVEEMRKRGSEEDYDWVLDVDLKEGLSVEPKGRASDDCPRLSDQCCLPEH